MVRGAPLFALTELEVQALVLSLRVGFWSVLVSLPFGVGVAWLLARGRFPGKSLLDAVVHIPLVVPPVAIGYLLLVALGRRGPVGGWLYDTFGIIVIVSAIFCQTRFTSSLPGCVRNTRRWWGSAPSPSPSGSSPG